jgi:hypothetical protein
MKIWNIEMNLSSSFRGVGEGSVDGRRMRDAANQDSLAARFGG